MKYTAIFAVALMLVVPLQSSVKMKQKLIPVCPVVKTKTYTWYAKDCAKKVPVRFTNA